jgi:hypothetical protein
MGVAITEYDTETQEIMLLDSRVLCPRDISLFGVLSALDALITEHGPISHVSMERYVAYKNVYTAEAENILMLIGGLQASIHIRTGITTTMHRAIDWKTWLVKWLFRNKNFDNPSDKLDKKFSVAAAKACLQRDNNTTGEPYAVNFKTDHEADAACLACLPFLKGW